MRNYFRVLTVRNIWVTAVSSFLLTFSLAFYSWFLPILLKRVGSIELVGVAYTLAAAVPIFLGPVAGSFADHYGRRTALIVGRSLIVLAYGALAIYLSEHTVIFAIVAVGAASVFASVAIFSLIAESVSEGQRSYAYAITMFVPYMAGGLGSYILGNMAERDLPTAVLTTFLLGVVGLAATFLYRETKERNPSGGRIFNPIKALKSVKSLGIIYLYLAMAAMLAGLCNNFSLIYIPIYLGEQLNFSERDLGIIYAIPNVMAIMSIPMGAVVAALGGLRALQLSMLIMAFSTIALMFVQPGALIVVTALFAIFTTASILNGIADDVFIASITTSQNRSTLAGSLVPIVGLGALIAPTIGAYVYTQNPQIIPLAAALPLFLIFLLLVQIARLLKNVSQNKT